MSDHLIAEANRHAMALPSTHPTHAEIAWYVREIVELRAENERLTKENSAAHAALNDSVGYLVYEAVIARAERAEAENSALRADGARLDFILSLGSIARFSAACLKLKIESTGEQWLHDARRAIDAAMKENYK